MRKGSGMRDAWRAYLELTLGLTEASKRKAQQVAKKLADQGGATAAQLQSLAGKVATSRPVNPEASTTLVRSEIERVLGVMGLARAEEVAELNERVRELERRLAQTQARPTADSGGEAGAAGVESGQAALSGAAMPSPRPAATKAVAKKAVAKKAVAKKTVAKKAVAKKAVAKKAVAKEATPAEPSTGEPAIPEDDGQ